MRGSLLVGMSFVVGGALLAQAAEPPIRVVFPKPSSYANPCEYGTHASYAQKDPVPIAAATTPVSIDIRVIELDHTGMRQLGVDVHFTSGFQQVEALLSFLPALEQENLVKHDVGLNLQTNPGQTSTAVLRWPSQHAQKGRGEERVVRFVIHPTLDETGLFFLEATCQAQLISTESAEDQEFGVQKVIISLPHTTADITRGFAVKFTPSTPGNDFLAVQDAEAFVIVTLKGLPPATKHPSPELRHDLLAPVNVLGSNDTRY